MLNHTVERRVLPKPSTRTENQLPLFTANLFSVETGIYHIFIFLPTVFCVNHKPTS